MAIVMRSEVFALQPRQPQPDDLLIQILLEREDRRGFTPPRHPFWPMEISSVLPDEVIAGIFCASMLISLLICHFSLRSHWVTSTAPHFGGVFQYSTSSRSYHKYDSESLSQRHPGGSIHSLIPRQLLHGRVGLRRISK